MAERLPSSALDQILAQARSRGSLPTMNVLAFDACLGAVSAAAGILRADGHWEREASEHARVTGGHAEALMPMIDRVMRKAAVPFDKLDRVVTTLGPGGFTGVRVAVAAARGLVLATGAAGVGLSTLDALAIGARCELGAAYASHPLAVAVDGRRGMVFFALYNEGVVTAEPELLSATQAAARVPQRACILVGSAAPDVAAELQGVPADVRLVDLQPDARIFAPVAATAASGQPLMPIYLRPPDAKAQTSFTLPRVSA